MSEAPRFQLGLFGGEEPALPLTAVRVAEEMIAAKPRREVSYERAMRAAQSTLAISLDPPDIERWREDMAAVAAGLPGFEPAPYLARVKWVQLRDPKALPLAELKVYFRYNFFPHPFVWRPMIIKIFGLEFPWVSWVSSSVSL